MTARLLVVDDDKVALANLALAMRRAGYKVQTASGGEEACALLGRERFDVVLTDLKMPGVDGLAVVRCCRERQADAEVIVLTAFASVDNAVGAMREGAFNYLSKPYRLDEVRAVVAEAVAKVALRAENRHLREALDSVHGPVRIITRDPVMLGLMDMARRVAPTGCNVLITGESGTGKELFARYLHAHSDRPEGPFLAVNCGAFHEDLLANELFGHEKGAFTGASADKPGLIEAAGGGTLFLDEVTEMTPGMQVKLLRVIQERELMRLGGTRPVRVDVRFIAATNQEVPRVVESGQFRQDLFYRLNVVNFDLPPLRARRDDVPPLAEFFLSRAAAYMRKDVRAITREAMDCLVGHDYPGNVRELLNLVERGIAVTTGTEMGVEHLPGDLCQRQAGHGFVRKEGRVATLEEHEMTYIRWVLGEAGGNQSLAAKWLGINRVSLWRKLKDHLAG
ncbi:MAG: sigma-54-dependent Fis family transcriptional regulator [Thiobacillus sp.]|nr:sigma-54-dependent Fis family transcriptional regulator [Thiobacillus sp.]